jgi:hypothetical protein
MLIPYLLWFYCRNKIQRLPSGEAAVESCLEAGASAFLQLGPGAALSNMFASAYPNIPSRSLDDFRSIQGVASWVTRFVRGTLAKSAVKASAMRTAQ